MKITVIFIGGLKAMVGQHTVLIDLPEGATYGHLLEELDHRFGKVLPKEIWDSRWRCFKGSVIAIGDGRDLDNPDIPLKENEEVKLLTAMAGG